MVASDLPRLLWIASYPKSGNTWVRNFLYRYLFGDPPNEKGIGKRMLALDRLIIEVGVDQVVEELEIAWSTNLFPEWPGDVPELLPIKTHYAHSEHHPLISRPALVVLIVRHPKDVALSAINFRRMRSRLDLGDRAYLERFIAQGGDVGYRNRGYGTWVEHARSWVDQCRSGSPVLVMGYSDLLADPVAGFTRMIEFMGAAVDLERLESSVAASSFESLRRIEEDKRAKRLRHSDEVEVTPDDTERFFFNKGVAGQTLRDTIGVDLDKEFDTVFVPQIEALDRQIRRAAVERAGTNWL